MGTSLGDMDSRVDLHHTDTCSKAPRHPSYFESPMAYFPLIRRGLTALARGTLLDLILHKVYLITNVLTAFEALIFVKTPLNYMAPIEL